MVQRCLLFVLMSSIASVCIADEVRLSNGDVLTGTIIEKTAASTVIDHAVLGRVEITSDRIAATATPDEIKVPVGETKTGSGIGIHIAPLMIAAQDNGEAAAEDKSGWKSVIDIGINGATGNSENVAFYGRITSKKEEAMGAWIFDAAYRYAKSEGVSTQHDFTGGIRKDWRKEEGSPCFYFADARFDWSHFKAWQTRYSGHVGIGHDTIQDENLKVTFKAGLGAVTENGSAVDGVRAEGLLGFEGVWTIDEHQEFTFHSTAFPDFDESGEWRFISGIEWSMVINTMKNASLKIGANHEHDTQAMRPTDKNDLFYYLALSFEK